MTTITPEIITINDRYDYVFEAGRVSFIDKMIGNIFAVDQFGKALIAAANEIEDLRHDRALMEGALEGIAWASDRPESVSSAPRTEIENGKYTIHDLPDGVRMSRYDDAPSELALPGLWSAVGAALTNERALRAYLTQPLFAAHYAEIAPLFRPER